MGEGAALGAGGMSDPKPAAGGGGEGGREPLPPASPSDLVPFLCSCTQLGAASCSARGPGRRQQLPTAVRAELVPGWHRPSALPLFCKLTQTCSSNLLLFS